MCNNRDQLQLSRLACRSTNLVQLPHSPIRIRPHIPLTLQIHRAVLSTMHFGADVQYPYQLCAAQIVPQKEERKKLRCALTFHSPTSCSQQ